MSADAEADATPERDVVRLAGTPFPALDVWALDDGERFAVHVTESDYVCCRRLQGGARLEADFPEWGRAPVRFTGIQLEEHTLTLWFRLSPGPVPEGGAVDSCRAGHDRDPYVGAGRGDGGGAE